MGGRGRGGHARRLSEYDAHPISGRSPHSIAERNIVKHIQQHARGYTVSLLCEERLRDESTLGGLGERVASPIKISGYVSGMLMNSERLNLNEPALVCPYLKRRLTLLTRLGMRLRLAPRGSRRWASQQTRTRCWNQRYR